MRTAFIKTLFRLAGQDPRITLVVGDLGFGVVTDFARQYPNQFLNAGVSEQNMSGLAAGLAMGGRIVLTYSIANFPTLRCIEQIRNDICYHNANVKVVSVGGGYAYGSLGMTHHATEDLSILRSLPNIKVVAPADPVETELAVEAMLLDPSPYYLRLGRAGEPVLHTAPVDFAIGRAIKVREGTDITLISTGGMLENSLAVAGRLSSQGTSARVLSMHTIKPLDVQAIHAAARETPVIVTVEEHSEIGGLGSAVADVLAETGYSGTFRKAALPDRFTSVAGDYEYLRALGGLDPEGLYARVSDALHRESRRGFVASLPVPAMQEATA